MNRTQAAAALNTAIATYVGDTGPGTWLVTDNVKTGTTSINGSEGVALTYQIEGQTDADLSDAWAVWGGNAILAAAGLKIADGMAESYTDKHGDEIYNDHAVVETTESRDLSAWDIQDERTDKTITPADLFADAQWIDSQADDYEPSTLTSERAIDDSDTHIYELQLVGCVAYVVKSAGCREIVLVDSPMKWREFLTRLDTSYCDGDFAVLLADFGLSAGDALDEADDTHTGPCKVWITRNFFAGTLGDTRDGYYRNPESNDDVTKFNDLAAAQAWVDEQESGIYYLGNGEAGRPSYTICKA